MRGHVGREVTIGIRPEDLHVATDADPVGLTFPSKVEVVSSWARRSCSTCAPGTDMMVAVVDPTVRAKVDEHLRLAVNPARIHFFDAKTEAAI